MTFLIRSADGVYHRSGTVTGGKFNAGVREGEPGFIRSTADREYISDPHDLRSVFTVETLNSFLQEIAEAPTADAAMEVMDRVIDEGHFIQGATTSLILNNYVVEYHNLPQYAENHGLLIANELGIKSAPTLVALIDKEGLSVRVLEYLESVTELKEFGKADHSKITPECYVALRDDLRALVEAGYYHAFGSESVGYWEVAGSGTLYLRGFASMTPLEEKGKSNALAAISTTLKGLLKDGVVEQSGGQYFEFEGEKFSNMTAFSNAIRFPVGSQERADLALQDPETAKATSTILAQEGRDIAYHQDSELSLKSEDFKKGVMPQAIAAYTRSQGKEVSRRVTEANVVSNSEAYGLVSNFAETPFIMEEPIQTPSGLETREITFRSVEAFVHYIKCPEGYEGKEAIADLSRVAAKRALDGDSLKELKKEIREKLARGETPSIYWGGRQMEYRSEEHFELIKTALRAKFDQHDEAMTQLKNTGTRTITHNTGRRESRNTSLPASVFTRMLTELREEFRRQGR